MDYRGPATQQAASPVHCGAGSCGRAAQDCMAAARCYWTDMSDDRPILFFDSGIGGLSVLGPTRALLPQAPFVYVADNAGFPYGIKTEAEIAARVPALLGRLAERYDPRVIVIACNTASTIALSHVRSALDLPIVGTVPAIKPAALASKSRVIGVLGTDATVRQPYVDRLSSEFASDCVVLRHGSADLVQAAESKLRGQTPDPRIFASAIAGLTSQPHGDRLDIVVLACTHFPLVETELAAAAPQPLTFVDGSAGIARRTAFLTQGQHWPADPGEGLAVFTKASDAIDSLRPALAAYGLSRIATL